MTVPAKTTHVLAMFILDPAPTYSVFDAKLDPHIAVVCRSTVPEVFVLLLWADVCIRVERLGIHLNKVGCANDPMLDGFSKRCTLPIRTRGKHIQALPAPGCLNSGGQEYWEC